MTVPMCYLKQLLRKFRILPIFGLNKVTAKVSRIRFSLPLLLTRITRCFENIFFKLYLLRRYINLIWIFRDGICKVSYLRLGRYCCYCFFSGKDKTVVHLGVTFHGLSFITSSVIFFVSESVFYYFFVFWKTTVVLKCKVSKLMKKFLLNCTCLTTTEGYRLENGL